MGFRVWILGFGVWVSGLEFRVWRLEFWIWCGVCGFGVKLFGVQGVSHTNKYTLSLLAVYINQQSSNTNLNSAPVARVKLLLE